MGKKVNGIILAACVSFCMYVYFHFAALEADDKLLIESKKDSLEVMEQRNDSLLIQIESYQHKYDSLQLRLQELIAKNRKLDSANREIKIEYEDKIHAADTLRHDELEEFFAEHYEK